MPGILFALVSECQKKIWKIHKISCVAAGSSTTGPKSPSRIILEDPTLNHKVNDRVLVKHESHWKEAVVVALWTKMPDSTSKAPYLVKLESTTTDTSLQVASDSTDLIRKLQMNALDNVLFAIKCGDHASEVERMATQYQLDFSLVSKRMLLETAIVGNISVAEWLMMTFHREEDSCNVVDDKGRNLVHLSIHHKQYNYLLDLIVNPWKGGDYGDFKKVYYWYGDHSLPFAVDGSGNNILHYLVLTGDAKFLAQILNMRVVSRHSSAESGQLCAKYDYAAAARKGNVIGLDRQPNNSDKTPRDLASLRGRKDMLELFDQFHKKVVLNYIGKWLEYKDFSDDEAIAKSREFIKKCKGLLKDCNITSPAQYLQEDPALNRLFYSCLVNTAIQCSDLFLWIMKEFKVSLASEDRTRMYDTLLNGNITTLMTMRPFTYRVNYNAKNEDKMEVRCQGIDSFADFFSNWSREPSFTEAQLLDDFWVSFIQNTRKGKKHFPTYDAVEFVRSTVVEKWGGKTPSYNSDEFSHQMAHELLSKMNGDPERLAILQYAVSKSIIARPPLHEYVVKGELDMLQWHCDTNKCDLRLPLSSSKETASFFSTYCESRYWGDEAIKSLTGSDIDAGELTLAEAMCAVAVCEGEFPVFQFLMREKVDNKGFFVNGMNMLHLAAVNNSLLMVKWLVFHNYIPVDARTKTAAGANACHLTYLYYSHWAAMTSYLKEELPHAVDSEDHGYDWYRRAKLKREQPGVDWDRLDLVLSQLREVTRMVEDGVDFCEARSLLESGVLGDEMSDETTWKDHYSVCGGKHRLNSYSIKDGEDEVECDEYSFVDWYFKFVKRAIKLNRDDCLQWLISFYRQMYRDEKLGSEGYSPFNVPAIHGRAGIMEILKKSITGMVIIRFLSPLTVPGTIFFIIWFLREMRSS